MISCELAELLGMHAGDGTIYKTKYSLVYELRGGKDEKEFYDTYVLNLFNKVLNTNFTAKERSGGKNGCYGIRTCNKDFINIFLNAGFPIGSKSLTVEIPQLILCGTAEMKSSFLRGLFATDGTAYLARINNNKTKTYPIIEFASISKKLRNQTKQLLEELGIECNTWIYIPKKHENKTAFYLRLAGIQKCKLFEDKIGLSNPKHRLKIITIFKKDLQYPVSRVARVA